MEQQFSLISKIGGGSFGDVFLCNNNYLNNRKEAHKVIRDAYITEEKKKKTLFESSVLSYLRSSPYIVEIYGANTAGNDFVIQMEYIEKGSLQQELNKEKFFNLEKIIKISECVLQALEYAHIKSILHLDIKPGNILVKNENVYKLSDFGLSGIKDDKGYCEFKEIYDYNIPPEKIKDYSIQATEQTDVYMFGITLYRMLNGDEYLSNQFDKIRDDNDKVKKYIIGGKFPMRDNYMPHVQNCIKKIINKCLNIDITKRYKNIREVKKDLAKIKLEYNWIKKNISENIYHWECFYKGKILMELMGEKNIKKNTWNLLLYKYIKVKKIRITEHCKKNVSEIEFYKNVNIIFNKYL